MIAAALIREADTLIEKSKIADANSPLFILSPKSLKKVSLSLKHSNWTNMAVIPQIRISNSELLTDKELAKGMAIPIMAPEKDTAAAVFPALIKVISRIGVSST